MSDEKKCVCLEWANRMQRDYAWRDIRGMAVTFSCEVHGAVTFDPREIPAPEIILPPDTRHRLRNTW